MAIYWLLSGRVGSENSLLWGLGGNALYLAFFVHVQRGSEVPKCDGLSNLSMCPGHLSKPPPLQSSRDSP